MSSVYSQHTVRFFNSGLVSNYHRLKNMHLNHNYKYRKKIQYKYIKLRNLCWWHTDMCTILYEVLTILHKVSMTLCVVFAILCEVFRSELSVFTTLQKVFTYYVKCFCLCTNCLWYCAYNTLQSEMFKILCMLNITVLHKIWLWTHAYCV